MALIGSFVKNELVSRQLPDQAGIQLGIDRWNSSTHENTQTTSSRLSLEDSDGDENWLAAPSAPSPIHVVDDDATTSQPKNSTEPHPHNQIHPSSERMQKAHEVWGGYIAHLTNNLFLLVVLIARSYPVCWMVRLKLLESFLVVSSVTITYWIYIC
ncbi:hypothetical protein EON65_16490 [archaeon]|nr:MAG: hypothetical protein EON65_16490 [archaeon]